MPQKKIWFQNRRQNDRRRSKPLDPSDYLPSFSQVQHSGDAESQDESSQPLSCSQESVDFRKSQVEPGITTSPTCSFDSNAEVENTQQSSQSTVAFEKPEHYATPRTEGQEPPQPNKENPQTDSAKRKRSIFEDERPSHSRVENRRSLPTANVPPQPPSLRISLSFDGEAVLRKEGDRTPSPPKPRDAMRISMSADGEALIRTANEPSPSKDRGRLAQARRARFGGLRRCNSASVLGGSTRSADDMKEFGRSRNSHAWELQCDTDARSALASTGLRRTSSVSNQTDLLASQGSIPSRRKSELGSRGILTNRTNLPNATTTPSSGQPVEKRQKLTRTTSSLARLETNKRSSITGSALADKSNKLKVPSTKSKQTEELYTGGDSDKENWVPGTQMSNVRRRSPQKQRVRRGIFQRSLTAGDRSLNNHRSVGVTSMVHKGLRGLQSKKDKENIIFDDDKEASKTSRSEAPSQEEDLDCIQGLLSLSQGAWK